MERGTGVFRGVSRDASSLGKGIGEIVKKFCGHAVPDLYPKLELGSRPLKGTEAEDFLNSIGAQVMAEVEQERRKHGLAPDGSDATGALARLKRKFRRKRSS